MPDASTGRDSDPSDQQQTPTDSGADHESVVHANLPADAGDITQLLHAWRAGNPEAENHLFERVYADLQRLARLRLRGEGKRRPMQTTELVDQIYLRLVASKDRDWQNRQHFFAIAGRAMRRYLIDLARARPDIELIGLDHLEQILPAGASRVDAALILSQLLEQLERENAAWCHLVELKFFLGLNDEEAADVLQIKLRTMQRMWRDARRWLFERMESAHGRRIGN